MTIVESPVSSNWNTDMWQTPDEIAHAMAQLISKSDRNILEPAAGTGQIAKYLPIVEGRIVCCEINSKRVTQGIKNTHPMPFCFWYNADFLGDIAQNLDWKQSFDLIITNPPFSQCVEFIERSLCLLNPDNPQARLIFLLPLDWNCSKARGAHWQRLNAHIHKEYRIMGRVAFLDGEGMPRSRRQCCDAVFDIRPGRVESGVSYLGN